MPCLVLSCLVWSGLVWSGLVWSGLVWSGLVWSGLVLSCLVHPELDLASFFVGMCGKGLCVRSQFLWEGAGIPRMGSHFRGVLSAA